MAETPAWLSIRDAVDEILKRQRSGGGPQATPVGALPAPAQPDDDAGVRYGALYAPPPNDLAGLRRRQAEFGRITQDLDRQNSWMAIPALAPAALVGGLGAAAAIAARSAPVLGPTASLTLQKVGAVRRGGNIYEARVGRRADKFYKDMARAKDGWTPGPRVAGPNGRTLIPDVGAPPRTPNPERRRYIEVKPDTPTGRAAAARQVQKYKDATRQNVRALFYDPKRFR